MKPSVAICIPSGDTWKALMAVSMVSLGIHSAEKCTLMPINVYTQDTAEARNQMTDAALGQGAEWLLWVDADMVFPPNSLERLMAHNVDAVGADYRRRKPPFPRIGKPVAEAEATSGLVEVSMLGLGMLLVRAEVLRKMGRPAFLRAWYLDNATETNPTGFATEDSYFCNHARYLGHKVWADLDLSAEVGHICEAPIGWNIGGEVETIPGRACLQSSA